MAYNGLFRARFTSSPPATSALLSHRLTRFDNPLAADVIFTLICIRRKWYSTQYTVAEISNKSRLKNENNEENVLAVNYVMPLL